MTQNLFTGLRDDIDSLISRNPYRRRRRSDRVSTEQLEIRCLLSAVVDLVADLNTSQGGTSSLTGRAQVTVNGITFFTASTLEYGDELWRTDGTDEGTFRLTDIIPGPGDSCIHGLTKVGDLLFFVGAGQDHGNAFWRSDGTVAGTQLEQKRLTGIGLETSSVMPIIGNSFCFSMGGQLWTSDGTDQGTRPYFDLPASTLFGEFSVSTNGIFYFTTFTHDLANSTNNSSLWISDGTVSGTRIAKTFDGYTPMSDLHVTNGQLFLKIHTGSSRSQLWISNGTDDGTTVISDISPWAEMTVTEDSLFFTVETSNHSVNLWTYKCIDQSLVQLTDNAEHIFVRSLVHFKNEVFFISNQQLWRTNGTSNGTTQVPTPTGVYFSSIANINGSLILSAMDFAGETSLWTSDGTTAGTSFLKILFWGSRGGAELEQYNIIPTANDSEHRVFVAWDEIGTRQIYTTDATFFGTRRLAAFAGRTNSSFPHSMANVDGELVFLTGQDYFYPDILSSSQSATHSIVNQGRVSQFGLHEGNFYYLKDTSVDNSSIALDLYRWNGSQGEFVLRIPVQFSIRSPPLRIADETYFFGFDYDPVRKDTVFQMRRSINGGEDSEVVKELPIEVGNDFGLQFQWFAHYDIIYFRVADNYGSARLWRSDGTSDGTSLVPNVYCGQSDWWMPFFAGSGNEIVLSAENELIATDGSVAGTHKLLDQRPRTLAPVEYVSVFH